MVFIPPQPGDVFEVAQNALGPSGQELEGFGAPIPPSQSGFGSRQSRIPNERTAVHSRNLVRWFVPEVGIIEMYINPQTIDYSFKKLITPQRTKGGYSIQYWGEELPRLKIGGTTGSSGVEGINVLEDVYRSEQLSFDPFALSVAAEGDDGNDAVLGNFLELAQNAVETGSVRSSRTKPTLASLAFSVEMFYAGWVFRGYFEDFSVNESAERIGLFNYNMSFVVTQKRGLRNNFFGWHRSATSGPSNSDPEFGVPHSFGNLAAEQSPPAPQQRAQTQQEGVSLFDALESATDFVSDALETTEDVFTSIF